MQTMEKEEKDPSLPGDDERNPNIWTRGRQPESTLNMRGGEGGYGLCDTKVINTAVQSKVSSVDCAHNEGGLLGFRICNPAEPS